MFGYTGSGHSYADQHSISAVQSPTGNLPSIPSLFSHLHSHGSPGGPATPGPDDPHSYGYHQSTTPVNYPSYPSALKRPGKKKPRPPKMGPDGIPCKRKSREGTTTYLWEFLLKLLQVNDDFQLQNLSKWFLNKVYFSNKRTYDRIQGNHKLQNQ